MKPVMQTQSVDIIVDLQNAVLDADARVLKNVAILGSQSVNSTGKTVKRFTQQCLESAARVFENAGAYIDHPGTSALREHRSIRDMYGVYKNVRVEEGKVKGDIHVFDTEDGRRVLSIAATSPSAVGNSIRASGRAWKDGKVLVFEELYPRTQWGIPSGVDLVGDPATTSSLFENKQAGTGDTEMEWNDVTIAGLQEQRPELYDKILKEGAVSRDSEVKGLTEAKDKSSAETKALKTKVDVFETKERVSLRRVEIDALLEASKLPKDAITDHFKGTLYSLEETKEGDKTVTVEAQANVLIEDRMSLIETVQKSKKSDNGGVRNMGNSPQKRVSTSKRLSPTGVLEEVDTFLDT